jgi:hypothetical protein
VSELVELRERRIQAERFPHSQTTFHQKRELYEISGGYGMNLYVRLKEIVQRNDVKVS